MQDEAPANNAPNVDFVPKVFVSYSWTGKGRAKALADRLRTECRVDVVIDIYHLKPGQNKYAFMQRIVDDDSIDHVLVLCDRAYRDKANNFEGGVGDEATIISPKIYKDANQTKFIPIVMEKDEQDNPYLPTFVDGRIYFDLSNPKTYDSELKRIVRHLYDLPSDREPPLGVRPKWLDFPSIDTTALESHVNAMSQLANGNIGVTTLAIKATDELVYVLNSLSGLVNSGCDLQALIAQTDPIRVSLQNLLVSYAQLPDCSGDAVAQIFERMNNGITPKDDLNSLFCQELNEAYRFFFWEGFISATAILVHYEKFAVLRQLLDRTYFVRALIGSCNGLEPNGYPYFRWYFNRLEDVYRLKITEQRPYTLAGRTLMHRLLPPIITEAALVNADLMLSHLSVCFQGEDGTWYPTLAPYWHYAGRDTVWSRLVSRTYCKKLYPLFDVDSLDALTAKLKDIDAAWRRTGISNSGMAYGGIPSISYFTPMEKVGTRP